MDGTRNGLENQAPITVFCHFKAKPGCESKLRELMIEMTRVTRSQDEGCITYVFYPQKKDPQQWMLHEVWRDPAALEGHVRNMKRQFGEPPPGARLPARMHELTETFRAVFYDPAVA
jgi:quinol monooxygenase YgiN